MQSTSEAQRHKQHYDRKANAISLEPGGLVLAKTNTYWGRRKVKDQWKEELYEVECQVVECIPSYLMKNQWTGHLRVLHKNQLFLITLRGNSSLYSCAGQVGQVHHHHPRGTNSEE